MAVKYPRWRTKISLLCSGHSVTPTSRSCWWIRMSRQCHIFSHLRRTKPHTGHHLRRGRVGYPTLVWGFVALYHIPLGGVPWFRRLTFGVTLNTSTWPWECTLQTKQFIYSKRSSSCILWPHINYVNEETTQFLRLKIMSCYRNHIMSQTVEYSTSNDTASRPEVLTKAVASPDHQDDQHPDCSSSTGSVAYTGRDGAQADRWFNVPSSENTGRNFMYSCAETNLEIQSFNITVTF